MEVNPMRGQKPHAKIVPFKRPDGLPKPPTWLSAGAKREWHRCAADLSRRGLLFDGAMASLATYCTLVDQIEQFGRVLAKEGMISEDGKAHDAHRALLATSAQARMLAAELGLSVVSRARSFQGKAADEREWDDLEVG
jgi:P27 family predicted phage terminase small subunit